MRVLCVIILFGACLHAFAPSPSSQLNSIIVPGMGGSYLYAEKNRIWPSPFPQHKNLLCSTEKKDAIYSGEIGSIGGILTGDWMSRTLFGNNFYSPLIQSLPGRVHGFPYDFRKIMDPSYLETLYDGYEEFFNRHSDTRYILYCHSLGGLLMHDFFSHRPSLLRYVKAIVYINCPFDGSVMPLPYLLGNIQTKLPIPPTLLPSPDCLLRFDGFFWCLPWLDPDRILVSSPSNISNTIRSSDLYSHRPEYKDFLLPRKQKRLQSLPNIRSILFYSRSSTATSEVFRLDGKHQTTENGDGVVSEKSLTLPLHSWSSPPILHQHFPNTDHSSILSDPAFLRECARIHSVS